MASLMSKLSQRPAVRTQSLTYKKAGVNIDVGNEFVRRIAQLNPSIGGFAGHVQLGDSLLVASTDGVGTKLKVAFEYGKHDTVGVDLVAMSVNDLVTCGAKPLMFLDYFATSKLDLDQGKQIIKGIVDGCQQAGCVLLGGETAEMPDFYQPGEYDLAGFAVGVVDKDKYIDGRKIKKHDVIMGLPSSGIHSNGFSLVREVVKQSGASLFEKAPFAEGTLGEELLTPTRIYVQQILALHKEVQLKGVAHITGGGMTENIPRMFPSGSGNGAVIMIDEWETPEVFKWIQSVGDVADDEMRRIFNMGIGMVFIVSSDDLIKTNEICPEALFIGYVVEHEDVQYV